MIPLEEDSGAQIWSSFSNEFPRNGSFVFYRPQSIELNDFHTMPVPMTFPDGTVVDDYWAACEPLCNWVAEHMVFQLNVQVKAWLQLRLIGRGVEDDADIARTFARLSAMGKYLPSIPRVEWCYEGYEDLAKWGRGVHRLSW